MKVLLSFVGEQDPISDNTAEEGSIVTLCRYLQPDVVYLYPSAAGKSIKSETQSHANLTKDWLATEVSPTIQVHIGPLLLPDPTDYAAILSKLHRFLKTHKELLDEDYELHLNCSSGTPQMKSIWLIIANSGLLPGCKLWQVLNPKFSGDRVKELRIEFLQEENILNRLQAFSRQFLFAHMAEEMGRLGNITLFAERKEKARFLQKLFWIYQNWDIIKYKEAYAGDGNRMGLRRLVDGFLPDPQDDVGQALKIILAQQADILAKLQRNQQKETAGNLTDLYYNAHRCFLRGNYTDTLARFWRVYEGLLYYHLRKNYGIEPTNTHKSSHQANFDKMYSLLPSLPYDSFGVRWAETVLKKVFQDKAYLQVTNAPLQTTKDSSTSLSVLLNDLRKSRNHSIVAHGMQPVDKDTAALALEAMQALFSGLLPAEPVADYPFQYSQLKAAVVYLTKCFSA